MKYNRIFALVVLGLVGGPLIGVRATAQEAAQKKHAQATLEIRKAKESGQRQASVYHDKIQALQKSLEELGEKRAELAKAKGGESKEVAGLTKRMDKLKKQAGELREMAKTNAKTKSSQAEEGKGQVAKEKLLQKQKLARSSDGDNNQPKIRQHGQVAGDKKKIPAIAAAESDDRPMIGGGKAKLQERKPHPTGDMDERRVIVREGVALKERRPSDRPSGQLNIEIDRERQRSDRGPSREQILERSPGPGPVEVTRRLHVLEDRLNAIERKLDAILDRLGDRAPRPSDLRNPNPGQGGPVMRERRQVIENAPLERRAPKADLPVRERREVAPQGVDDDQLRRPPRPDEAPVPPRGDSPPR